MEAPGYAGVQLANGSLLERVVADHDQVDQLLETPNGADGSDNSGL
jgi:hypothetical protein